MNAVVEQAKERIPLGEILNLAAVDSVFYCREFFPRTFRQASPAWHRDYWNHFDDQEHDLTAFEIFRGGGKTTLTRAGCSKRIAFGVSMNILSVAINETMASHTVRWLKRQIDHNHYWRETFNLRRGDKWTDDWITIQRTEGIRLDIINIMAKGMTSGLRGLNPDDWRPDFIQADDISNEETVGTEEQRIKNSELFFGALVPTLAPKSEAPLRKLVLNQTALHAQDIVCKAHVDPAFSTMKYSKLIQGPDDTEISSWEARFPTAECLAEKEHYIKRGQLHIYLREFGCKIVSRETAPLDATQLREWKALPTDLVYFTGLDPAISKAKKAHRTAAAVIGVSRSTGDVYLIKYKAQKGQQPNEMWEWIKDVKRNLRPRKFGVETVAFQKFLAWYFQQKMLEDKTWITIEEVADKRSKPDRIIQAFSDLAANGKLWVHANHTEFVEMYTTWTEDLDYDLLDGVAQAITIGMGLAINPGDGNTYENDDDFRAEEDEIPDLVFEDGAP